MTTQVSERLDARVIGKMPTAAAGFPALPWCMLSGAVHAQNPPERGVAGKRALITGAAGAIGGAAARALAAGGARVALVDLDPAPLEPLRDELAAASGRSAAAFPVLGGDVTDAGDVHRYTGAAADAMGGLDVLFNNAGIEGPVAPVQDYDDDEYDRVMRVNVRGVWLNLKRAVTLMLQGDGGSVINMASGAALHGLPLLSGYVASKHAVLGLTRTAAVELGDSGVRVNAVCAGPVATRMMDSLAERSADHGQTSVDEAHADFVRPIPMGRYGEPEEIAELVTFLASDASSYMTGAAISIDGGASAA
jgi:meso-butanediol dehydrogenase/(S,S)-butanediol dehydrogenase/diacetyl reductase